MAKECEVMSKTYKEIRVLPAALRASGVMEAHGTFSETLGFYITESLRTALGVHIPNKEATLIINGEIVTVTKKSGEIWVAGDAIFWLSGTTEFTNINDGSGLLVGKAKIAAATGDATGDIVFKDYYPVQRGIQIGTALIPYKIIAAFPDPILSLYATTALITGSIDAAKIDLVHTVEATSNYIKGLRVTVSSAVKTGASCRAIYGKIDYSAGGYAHGVAAVIGSELALWTGEKTRGSYFSFGASMNFPEGHTAPNCEFGFGSLNIGGNAAAMKQFDSWGVMFDIIGPAHKASGFLDTTAGGIADIAIRWRVNGVNYWMPLSTSPDFS